MDNLDKIEKDDLSQSQKLICGDLHRVYTSNSLENHCCDFVKELECPYLKKQCKTCRNTKINNSK